MLGLIIWGLVSDSKGTVHSIYETQPFLIKIYQFIQGMQSLEILYSAMGWQHTNILALLP